MQLCQTRIACGEHGKIVPQARHDMVGRAIVAACSTTGTVLSTYFSESGDSERAADGHMDNDGTSDTCSVDEPRFPSRVDRQHGRPDGGGNGALCRQHNPPRCCGLLQGAAADLHNQGPDSQSSGPPHRPTTPAQSGEAEVPKSFRTSSFRPARCRIVVQDVAFLCRSGSP